MGLTGMVFSTISIAVGAVMYWAVTNTQGHGFRLSTVGVILTAESWLEGSNELPAVPVHSELPSSSDPVGHRAQ